MADGRPYAFTQRGAKHLVGAAALALLAMVRAALAAGASGADIDALIAAFRDRDRAKPRAAAPPVSTPADPRCDPGDLGGFKQHLTQADLDAARRELQGEVIGLRPDGVPWDHVEEVEGAQAGLKREIARLKRMLGNSRCGSEERAAAEQQLGEASRLLDYSEQFVPPKN
jgi:hypothetical protein